MESWASYFEKLATPTDDESFDDEYNRHLETAYLLQSLNNNRQPLPPVGIEDVMQIVKKLKMGKAKDVFRISSEHIRIVAEPIFTVLTYLLNEVLRPGKLPDEYKLGTICPVPKKSKSARLPTNYRRITITSIVGKVAKIHIVNLMRKTADPIQSPLQFGFTSGISPNFAALIITEVMNQAKSNKSPLYLELIDTSKAFDVVNHRGMLNSAYRQGIHGQLWRILDFMYTNIRSMVNHEGETSNPFPELHGIRQGGSSSADIYKLGKNKLLTQINSMTNNCIGHFNVGALMVTDDLLLNSSNTPELQIAIALAEKDASREHYKFNADKTKIVAVKTPQDTPFLLYNKELGCSKDEPHLGISRNQQNNNKDTIGKRIQKARRATYILLGAGLSGIENVGPEVAIRGFTIYILPILLHGLEALVLTKTEVNDLALFQREMLRRFMKLSDSTAVSAIHLLSGTLPVEAEVHKQSLSLLRSALDVNPDCPPAVLMKDLVIHQLAMEESNRWATQMRSLLKQHKLPSANTLIQPLKKQQWKEIVKVVDKFWVENSRKRHLIWVHCHFWTSNSACRAHYILCGKTCTVSQTSKKPSSKQDY